jgi:hypothetical protein
MRDQYHLETGKSEYSSIRWLYGVIISRESRLYKTNNNNFMVTEIIRVLPCGIFSR